MLLHLLWHHCNDLKDDKTFAFTSYCQDFKNLSLDCHIMNQQEQSETQEIAPAMLKMQKSVTGSLQAKLTQ